MRLAVMVLAVVLATGAGVAAQTNPVPPAAPPGADEKLTRYLTSWEQEMRKIQGLSALLTRVDKDFAFKTTTKYNGFAQYLKSGSGATAMNLALLEMKQENKTDLAEKIICTGTYLYAYAVRAKEIRRYELPRPKPGQVADDNFLSFLFGMKAQDAMKKYNIKLAKEDKWYIYLDITPRSAADKQDFKRARLVLNKDNFLPRQLWFVQPNDNESTWDVPRIDTKASIDRRNFDAPTAPAGWKVVPQTSAAPGSNPPPRVVRPSDGR
jgi:TIGR03009 family protein